MAPKRRVPLTAIFADIPTPPCDPHRDTQGAGSKSAPAGRQPKRSAESDLYNPTAKAQVLCHASNDGLDGTVWLSQAVVFRDRHGLPAAPVNRHTRQSTPNAALGSAERVPIAE